MIQIKVRFFAVLKESLGKDFIEMNVPEGIRTEEVIRSLKSEFHECKEMFEASMFAVNGIYADDVVLFQGDELAVLPPVSGG
jgi:MoaD family protein